MTKTLIRTEKLANGLQIRFTDLSNRYFGDYHRLCIEVQISYDLPAERSAGQPDSFWQRARMQLGPRFTLHRRLERMGVPTAEVEAVRGRIVDDFLVSSLPYLQKANTPRALIEAELKKRQPRRPYGL